MFKKVFSRENIVTIFTAVVFAILLVLFLCWHSTPAPGEASSTLSTIAVIYLIPAMCIVGTLLLLYVLERCHIVRVKRSKKAGAILLAVTVLFLVWMVFLLNFSFSLPPYTGSHHLGNPLFESFIPRQMASFYAVHGHKLLGMLAYQIIGVCLFYSINPNKTAIDGVEREKK
ncbi:MAG: hypothetical protein RSG55_00440 [Oscillospiraceae bacterium]